LPNTLGLVVREGNAATERLIEGLADEDLSLFQNANAGREGVFLGRKTTYHMPPYKDLLTEID